MEFLDAPYTDTETFADDDYLNYNLHFNATLDDCDWHKAPVIINLHCTGPTADNDWEWRLYNYGEDKGAIEE